ncbi:MAG: thioredoxin [Lentisphaeria bacterium]|nr:thioredoxin [Lentisphaeria bacterium]
MLFGGIISLVFLLASYGRKPVAADKVVHSDLLKSVTAETFDESVAGKRVLVDFWATWCGPCQKQLPILNTVAEQVKGHAEILTVDVDDNKDLAKRFSVQTIPTLVLLEDGKEVQRFVGVQSEKKLIPLLTAEAP